METEILRKIGLTENEIKVYISLTKTGPSTATYIAKEARIHRSKSYDALQRLIDKGLVHFTTKNYKRIFTANAPEELSKIIQEKEEKLQKERKVLDGLILNLKSVANKEKEEPSMNVYEGIKGIKVFHNNMLRIAEKDKEIDVLGIPKIANELLEAYFLEFHKERAKKQIPIKLIYSHEAKDKAKQRNRLKLSKAKYLPEEIKTPSVVWIYKGIIGIFNFEPHPTCYEIKNQQIYTSFKSYFDFLWNLARN